MIKLIGRVARFLWSFPQIQRLLKQIKQGSALDTTTALKNLQPTGRFVRDDGNSVSVLAGYRDIVQPGWQNALLPNTHSIPTIGESEQTKDKVSRTTDDILRRLAALGLSLEGKDILEFGCNDGSKLFSLSEKIGGSFSGMDLPMYYSLGDAQKADTDFSSERSRSRSSTGSVSTRHRRACVPSSWRPVDAAAAFPLACAGCWDSSICCQNSWRNTIRGMGYENRFPSVMIITCCRPCLGLRSTARARRSRERQ